MADTVIAPRPGGGVSGPIDVPDDIDATGTPSDSTYLRGDGSWATPAGAGSGTVDTSGTPAANDFARFTDGNTIEGRSYAEVLADLGLAAELTSLTVPASTTISAFGASLINDADASTARATLELGDAATADVGDFATGAQGDTADAVDTALGANGKGVVQHGATAGTARPTAFAFIEWVGSVEPTNAIDGDTWIDTA